MTCAAESRGPVRRHRFSREILRAIKRSARLDNWHAPLELAEHWLVIGACVALSMRAWEEGVAAGALAYMVAIFIIGGRQRALAGVLHQACHGTLMANTRAARTLGTLPAGYLVLQSFTGYRSSHVRGHHAHLGDARLDPDYVQYQAYGICGPTLTRAALRGHLLTIAGPRSTAAYIAYLLRHRIWNGDEHPCESFGRAAYIAAIASAAAFSGWLPLVAAYWLLPLITTQVWIGMIAELLEHYPLIESAPREDIRISWNRHPGPLERFLLGEKKGEGYHLVHHLFPYVPLWRLAEVDRILANDSDYAALQRLGSSLSALIGMLAAPPAGGAGRMGSSQAG